MPKWIKLIRTYILQKVWIISKISRDKNDKEEFILELYQVKLYSGGVLPMLAI